MVELILHVLGQLDVVAGHVNVMVLVHVHHNHPALAHVQIVQNNVQELDIKLVMTQMAMVVMNGAELLVVLALLLIAILVNVYNVLQLPRLHNVTIIIHALLMDVIQTFGVYTQI